MIALQRIVFMFITIALVGDTGEADTLIISQPIPGLPETPGMLGEVYNLGSGTRLEPVPRLDLAALAAEGKPSASYIASTLRYGASVGQPVDILPTNQFLKLDANGTAATDTTQLQTTVLDMNAYAFVPSPGTYVFFLSADDAAGIYIGGNGTPGSGQQIVTAQYTHQASSDTATFQRAGLYSFEILYYNSNVGGSGDAYFTEADTLPGDEIAGSPHGALFRSIVIPEPSLFAAFATLLLLNRQRRT